MKRKPVCLLLFVLLNVWGGVSSAAEIGAGDKLSISVTNKFGDVLTNLTVVKILGDGLVLENNSGQVKVKYVNLPKSVREKYEPLAASATKKEKDNREAAAAFVAGMQKGAADVARMQTVRESQPLAREQPVKSGSLAIEIPGQGWKINLPNPGLEVLEKQANEAQFIYRAAALGADGYEISIYVEKPAGTGTANTDVFNYYWPKASRNPLIDEKSIKTETKEKFVKVTYTCLDIPQVNYYFAFKGRWIDVHLSRPAPAEKVFADFEQRFSYGQ